MANMWDSIFGQGSLNNVLSGIANPGGITFSLSDTKGVPFFGYKSPSTTTTTTTNKPATTGTTAVKSGSDASPGSVYSGSSQPAWYSAVSTLPKIDFNAWQQNAKNLATKDVTPYYQQQLTNYVNQYGAKVQQAQQGFQQAELKYNTQLEQYMGEANVKKERTGEDFEKTMSDIGTEQQAQQGEEAFTYDLQRRGAQEQLGEAGLTTSGIGRQSLANLQKMRGFSEDKQARVVEGQKYAADLFKNRTFEDIARGIKNEDTNTKMAIDFAKQDMDSAIDLLDLGLEVDKLDLEIKKQNDIFNKSQNYMQTQWRNYLNGLSTNQRVAAQNVYGSAF